MAKLQPTQSASLIGANNPRVTSPRNAQGIGGSPCPPSNPPECIITSLASQEKVLCALHETIAQLCERLADVICPNPSSEQQGIGSNGSRLRGVIYANTQSIGTAIDRLRGLINSVDL